MSDKKKKVEWSFDFESLGERVSQFFDDALGDDDSAVKSVELATPLDGAESAVVEIDFSIGKASLRALDGASDQLMTARLDYVGEYSFDVSGASHRHVTLRQSGQFPKGLKQIIGKRKELRWDIALARGIPLQLRIKGGVGETDIDLSGLQLDDIKLQTGVGKIALTLPAQNASYDAAVSGGVGKTDIVVPMGSHGHVGYRRRRRRSDRVGIQRGNGSGSRQRRLGQSGYAGLLHPQDPVGQPCWRRRHLGERALRRSRRDPVHRNLTAASADSSCSYLRRSKACPLLPARNPGPRRAREAKPSQPIRDLNARFATI